MRMRRRARQVADVDSSTAAHDGRVGAGTGCSSRGPGGGDADVDHSLLLLFGCQRMEGDWPAEHFWRAPPPRPSRRDASGPTLPAVVMRIMVSPRIQYSHCTQ